METKFTCPSCPWTGYDPEPSWPVTASETNEPFLVCPECGSAVEMIDEEENNDND